MTMKRKLPDFDFDDANDSNSPPKKKAKTPDQTPIDNTSIVVEKKMPDGKDKFAGKKIKFVLKPEATPIPEHVMSLAGYDEKKYEGTKLASAQMEHLRTILNTGTVADFNKKLELLQQFFIDHRKNFGTWEYMVGLEARGHHDERDLIALDDEHIVFWIIRRKRFDLLDIVLQHSIKVRSNNKTFKNYDKDDFFDKIMPALFKSCLPLSTIVELLNHYYPGKKSVKKIRISMMKSLRSDQRRDHRNLEKNENANLIEDLLLVTDRDCDSRNCYYYFDKIKWLVAHGEPIKPGLVHRLIDARKEWAGNRSIFKFYNEDNRQLFKWLLEQDKEHAGLYDKAYQRNSEHLRYLIENGIGPKEWTLSLAANLGLFEKYQELLRQTLERNPNFIRDNSQGENLLFTALQSRGYVDPLCYFKTIHFIVMQNSDFMKNGSPHISFLLLDRIGDLAASLYKNCIFSNSKEEKQAVFSTNHFWQMMSDLFLRAFDVLQVKAESFNQLIILGQGSLEALCSALKNIMTVESERHIRIKHIIEHSTALLHAFVKMLKQKPDFAAISHHTWVALLVDGLSDKELAKRILIELAKEELDISEAVINVIKFPENPRGWHAPTKIYEATTMLQRLKELLKEPIIKGHIKNKNALSLGMLLAFKGIGKELKEILNLLQELGGDPQWRPTAAELKNLPSISQEVTPGHTLLLSHLEGFVDYRRTLNYKNANEKKRFHKLYDEKKAFSMTQYLLEKKVDHTIEFDFKLKGYVFKGTIFDYIAMINRVDKIGPDETESLALHEEEFFRNDRFQQMMQAARERTEARILRGPNDEKAAPVRRRQPPPQHLIDEQVRRLEAAGFLRPMPMDGKEMKGGGPQGPQLLLAQQLDFEQFQQALAHLRQADDALRQADALRQGNVALQQAINVALRQAVALRQQAQPAGANGVAQPQPQPQPAAPMRAPAKRPQPQLQRIHEDKQNTHGAAVHEMTAAAALKLKKTYLPAEGDNLKSLILTTSKAIGFHYARQVLADFEAALNRSHPAEKYTDQTFRKAQIESTVNAVKKHIIYGVWNHQRQYYFYHPCDFAPELWTLKSFIAYRFLGVKLPSMLDWKEPSTQVTLEECLMSVWLALHDRQKCTNDDKEAMLRQLTDHLVDIQHHYQHDLRLMEHDTILEPNKLYLRKVGQQIAYTVITPDNKIVRDIKLESPLAPEPFTLEKLDKLKQQILEQASKADHAHSRPACASGAFNKFIETLEGQHTDVPIINRIRIGNVFDYVVGYYEEKFNQLDIQQKRHYLKTLLDSDEINLDTPLPEQFINDFEKGFYERHQPDIDKRYIALEAIKNLFHNEYVPWIVKQFRVIAEFIKQEFARKKSASQSSSSSQPPANNAAMEVTPQATANNAPMELTPQAPMAAAQAQPLAGQLLQLPPIQPQGGNLLLNIQGNNNHLVLGMPQAGPNPYMFFHPAGQQPQQQQQPQPQQQQPGLVLPPLPAQPPVQQDQEPDKGNAMDLGKK